MASETMITFKLTAGQHECIELAYESDKTVGDYIEDLSSLYEEASDKFKLVFKGKVLTWKETAEKAKLSGGTVMVVINTAKKQPKKVVASKDQIVPGAGMSTGLGASSPFGVGGYEMINHPQYMSAISSAVDPDKMEQMMQDPQMQGMLESMLDDPETLSQLMKQNPMVQSMIKNNPMMKYVFENPNLLKMMLNKDMLKKTKEMMKSGVDINDPQSIAENLGKEIRGNATQSQMPGMGGQIGAMGQSSFGGFGGMPQMSPMMNQTNPMMNPFLLSSAFSQSNQQGQGQQGQGKQFFQPPSTEQQKQAQANFRSTWQNLVFSRLYSKQLSQLQSYGFKDRAKNLSVLKQTKGNLDEAIQKLCQQ